MNATMGAGLKGLELVKTHPEMREQLRKNAFILKKGLQDLEIPVDDNSLPIAAFRLGSSLQMEEFQKKLFEEGIYIQYSRYRGAEPEGVLRIVVFSNHSEDQIGALISGLKKHLPASG
jgi:glycine C-acetyltransferase